MASSLRTVRYVIGGLFAWSASVFFGAVFLDVVYSSLLGDPSGSPLQSVYREVSDFLLVLGAPTLLVGLLAAAISWSSPPARNLFLISLLCLSLEFSLPIILFPLLRTSDSSTFGFAPYVRLVPLALASLLALAAFRGLSRDPLPRGG
jgi:hypothetical protein